MELHEVKIGDLVSYKDKFKRTVKGKVVHRFEGDDKPHLSGHVNVQKIDGSSSYPKTIHVSNLTPCFEEGTSMEFSSLKEDISAMLADLRNGANIAATEKFNDILTAKVDEVIMSAKVDVANALFNSESVDEEFIDDAEEIEFLTQEEFDTLSDEEKEEFEAIEVDDELDEGNAANKAKKNSYEDSVGKKFLKKGIDRGYNYSEKTLANPRGFARIAKYMAKEAYSDPYAAKKAAEMKKAHSEKIKGIKKEFDADKSLPNPFMKLKKGDPRYRYEEVELMDEGNAENKAKKNAFVRTLSKKGYTNMLKKGRDTLKGDPYVIKHKNKMKAALYGKEQAAFDKEIKAQKAKQNEEVEQIDELTNKTLKSYVKKAASSIVKKNSVGTLDRKRAKGITRAADKLGISREPAVRASTDATMQNFHTKKGDALSAAESEKSKSKNLSAFKRSVNKVQEEVQPVNEKLTDAAKRVMKSALTHNVPKGTKKTSAQARAMIKIAKMNPDNTVKKLKEAAKADCKECGEKLSSEKQMKSGYCCSDCMSNGSKE